MKKIVIIMFFGLLFFGCLGGGQQTQNQTQQAQNQQQTGNNTQATGNATSATGTGTQGTGSSQSGTDVLSINTYSLAVAAGIPLECTAIINGETTKYWIKGDKMLISGTSGGKAFTGVLKGSDMYVQLSAEDKASYTQMGLTCDWFLFEGNESESSSSSVPSVDTTSYTSANVAWTCQAAAFGDEKFTTSGTACTMDDLMNAMQAQYQQ